MYRIGICDDKQKYIDELARICDAFFASAGRAHTLVTYTDGEALLREGKVFDILLLDIDMPGLNGIELARHIRQYDTGVRIIYVTNYADYRNHAFSVHAFGYITKPVEREATEAVLRDAVAYGRHEQDAVVFTIRNVDGQFHLPLRDIRYFECRSHTVTAHTGDAKLEFTSSMKKLAGELAGQGFAECHRSYLVNMAFIRRISGLEVHMADGDILPLPQKKAAAFRKLHNQFLQAEAKLSRGEQL